MCVHISSTSIKRAVCWRRTVMGDRVRGTARVISGGTVFPQQDSDVGRERRRGALPWRLGHLQEVKAPGLGV